MANFEAGFSDIQDVIDIYDASRVEEVTDEILDIAGAFACQQWIESCRLNDHIDTHDMINSIKARRIKTKKDVAMLIFSDDKDRKGVRNAEKAFVLNYGKGLEIPASHWVDNAELLINEELEKITRQVLDKYNI